MALAACSWEYSAPHKQIMILVNYSEKNSEEELSPSERTHKK